MRDCELPRSTPLLEEQTPFTACRLFIILKENFDERYMCGLENIRKVVTIKQIRGSLLELDQTALL
jgi:hypothetical protein